MGESSGEFPGDAVVAVLAQPTKAGGGCTAASARVAQDLEGPLPKDRRSHRLGEVPKKIGENV
jgi:hypothetical protein